VVPRLASVLISRIWIVVVDFDSGTADDATQLPEYPLFNFQTDCAANAGVEEAVRLGAPESTMASKRFVGGECVAGLSILTVSIGTQKDVSSGNAGSGRASGKIL
jgi:hypothetical protein